MKTVISSTVQSQENGYRPLQEHTPPLAHGAVYPAYNTQALDDNLPASSTEDALHWFHYRRPWHQH